MKVLVATIPGMIEDADLDPVRELADVEYFEADSISEDELAAKCSEISVLMLNYDIIKKLSPSFYEKDTVKSLLSISTDITGMDWSNPHIAKDQGILLQHIPHYSTESVAETIICEVLMHSRQRVASIADKLAGQQDAAREGINLQGRVAGVVGYGSIGQRVAEILHCLGMEVLIWNRSSKSGLEVTSLEDVFSNSDVICLAMATQLEGANCNVGIIDDELLSLCKGSIIVNLAGEKLVDNAAIVAAINSGAVSGYSVELTASVAASPLANLPNVHTPPHNSWKSPESLNNLKNTWISNTISALQGDPKNIFVG